MTDVRLVTPDKRLKGLPVVTPPLFFPLGLRTTCVQLREKNIIQQRVNYVQVLHTGEREGLTADRKRKKTCSTLTFHGTKKLTEKI